MRFVTWNCSQGLDAKLQRLQGLAPDVCVIPECARPRFGESATYAASTSHDWMGSLEQKGLGIFTFHSFRLEVDTQPRSSAQHALAARVVGPTPFQLLAIWAQEKGGYAANVGRALEELSSFIRGAPTIIAGDFNSCAVMGGKPDRQHERLLSSLASLDQISAYHTFTGDQPGAESQATYYHRRKRTDRWHIDYVFIPAAWRERLTHVEVGTPEEWLAVSDHMPLVVDLDL